MNRERSEQEQRMAEMRAMAQREALLLRRLSDAQVTTPLPDGTRR